MGSMPAEPPAMASPIEKKGRPGIARFAGFHATASYPFATAVKFPPIPNAAALAFGSCASTLVETLETMTATRLARRENVRRLARMSFASDVKNEAQAIRDRHNLLRRDRDRRGRVHAAADEQPNF